jgi:tetratricopeptide (TPR) repeat protein
MEYQEFLERSQSAAQLSQAGRLKEAERAFYDLFLSDISDLDKAAVCAELASVYDRMGNTEQALAWFDKGIAQEGSYCRYEVAEQKVHYLAQIGQSAQAVPIFEALIRKPFLTEAEKERLRKETQALIGRAMRQRQ